MRQDPSNPKYKVKRIKAAVWRKIAQARIKQRLSQIDLAAQAEVSPTTVSRLENGGSVNPISVMKIGEALGLEFDDVVVEK